MNFGQSELLYETSVKRNRD